MALWNEHIVVKNQYSRPGFALLGVRGLVLHWTADFGATDENEVNFFDGSDGGGGRYASAHIFVDRDSATLDVPLNEVAYHANDKSCKIPKLAATASYYKNGGANLTSIGVEMCVEKDGNIHSDTIERTVQVMAQLCRQFGLTANDIYRHFDITGKNCPAPFVANPALFTDFKNRVAAALNGAAPAPVQTAPSAPAPTPNTTSIVDYLNSIGMDSSFANRKNLAIRYGIPNYSGTAAQNTELLNKMKTGSAPQPQSPPQAPAEVVIGVVTVIASGLNMRQGPGTNYPVVGKAVQGKDYNVYANVNDWHKIGPDQWVFGNNGEYLSLKRDTAPAPDPAAPAPARHQIHLPASATTWTVYKLDHPAVKANPANIAGTLRPSKFGGLTYDIIEDFGGGVYGIQTANFGHVKIYGAPSTGATIS